MSSDHVKIMSLESVPGNCRWQSNLYVLQLREPRPWRRS